MKVENMLSSRQTIILISLFLFGSSIVIGVNINSDVAQDSWLSLIFSFAFTIPFVLIIAKIINLFPQKNIYQIFDELFGKAIGKIFTILFILHTLYLGSIVLRNFSEYVEITTLSDTPQMPIMLSLILIAIYLAKSGIKTLGRWGPIIITIIVIAMLFTFMLSVPVLKLENIKPILEHSPIEMISSTFKVFMVPFSEIIIFLGFADCISIKNKEKKTYLFGITITGFILLSILLRNIMVLGVPMLQTSYFASYDAASILQLGEFLTRIEGVITMNFVLAGLTKIVIFVIVLSKGIAHLTKNVDYKNLVIPSSLLIFGICPFLFDNVLDMFDFAPIFGMYAIPIQVMLPIIIWIYASYKKKSKIIDAIV